MKRGPDRLVWETATEPLRDLLADGWNVTSITIEWGKTQPYVPAEIMHPWIRNMCLAPESARVTEQQTTNQRGHTLLRLSK
jgi:hypothetical protein